MDVFFVIMAVVLVLVFAELISSWVGRCRKCGSWKNWLKIRISTDNHQPSVFFENTMAECSNCHNLEFRLTVTRQREPGSYDVRDY